MPANRGRSSQILRAGCLPATTLAPDRIERMVWPQSACFGRRGEDAGTGQATTAPDPAGHPPREPRRILEATGRTGKPWRSMQRPTFRRRLALDLVEAIEQIVVGIVERRRLRMIGDPEAGAGLAAEAGDVEERPTDTVEGDGGDGAQRAHHCDASASTIAALSASAMATTAATFH